MIAARATICNKKGLHARAAAKLVNLAATFQSELTILRLPRAGAGSKTTRPLRTFTPTPTPRRLHATLDQE